MGSIKNVKNVTIRE